MKSRPPRDRVGGLLILVVAFVAALSLSWWARGVSSPDVESPPPPTVTGAVGFPHRVDAIASLDGARVLTARERLRGIVATGVASDGTVDVGVPGSGVLYVFQSNRGEGPQPPRDHGTLPKWTTCGRQTVHLGAQGFVADADQPAYACAAQRPDPLPEPRCGAAEVWKTALARGIPPMARAEIRYYRATAGPAWRFQIPGTQQHFVLYGDCGRELTGGEAFGSVP